MRNWTGQRKTLGAVALLLLVFYPSTLRANLVEEDQPIRRGKKVSSAKRERLRIVYYYSPTCGECREVEEALIEIVGERGDGIQVERENILEPASLARLFKYEAHYGVESASPPAIFVGEEALVGRKSILTELTKAIEKAMATGRETFMPTAESEDAGAQGRRTPESEIAERFLNLRIGTIILAGLLDGINPCAFTTAIFLISMLTFLGSSRRDIIFVGSGFTFGVFGTYLLLGVGCLEAIKAFSVHHGIAKGLAYGVAALTFVLAAWSLVDAIRFWRTRSVKIITLGLPKGLSSTIRKIIRSGLASRWAWGISLLVGAAVALLESVCTGQVYLPTIMLMARTSEMKVNAIGYLVLYNVVFICPLAVVIAVGYCGISWDRLGVFLRDHLTALKLALAVLFAGLGSLILMTV